MQASNGSSLSGATIKGVLWLLFQSAGARIVGILSQLVLARLLLPSQFGVISLVYTVTSLANALVNFGVDGVLLQRHKTLRLWIVPSFWMSFGLGVVGFAVVACAAPVFAHLYKTPQVTSLAILLALSIPLGALSTIPTVKMRSDLDFRFPAVYSTIENVVSQVATIVLAFAGFGALSFVLPTPILAGAKAVIYWWRAPISFRGRLRVKQFAYLLNNGMSVFGSRLIGELISQGDYAVLGFTATHSAVGLYFFAFRLAAQPVWILAGNFTNVLFPALVQLKNDPERQLKGALRAAELLSYVVMPICFLQAAISGPALRLFFGLRWAGSIHLTQLLSLGMPFDAVPWVAGSLLSARRDFRRGLLYALVTLPVFFILVGTGAVLDQATGVALAVGCYYLLLGPIYSVIAFKRYGAKASDVLTLYTKPPLLAGGAMGLAYALSFLPIIRDMELLRLAVVGAMGPIFYAIALWRFEPGILNDLMNRFGAVRLLGPITRFANARMKIRLG